MRFTRPGLPPGATNTPSTKCSPMPAPRS